MNRALFGRVPSSAAAVVVATLLALTAPAVALAQGAPPVDGKTAFARLKSLAGEWKGTAVGQPAATVRYQVTAGGTAVFETLYPGSDHEMVSVYTLDHGDLVMTHYCAAGNQPHMRLDSKASTSDLYVFAFDGGTNFDPAKDMHIHSMRLAFKGDHLESEWAAMADGKPAPDQRFVLSRQ
ncbi:MAG TPA: hypothetical protein VGE98_15360 [Thermoanaerobaculia bacterium]